MKGEILMEKKFSRIIRKPEMLGLIGLSDATLWRREKMGDFPKRISLGGNSVGWFEDEFEQWLNKKKDERERGLKTRGPENTKRKSL